MLGEQVRNVRKSRGITLKELAERTGLSIGYISQIERDLTDSVIVYAAKIKRGFRRADLSVYGSSRDRQPADDTEK